MRTRPRGVVTGVVCALATVGTLAATVLVAGPAAAVAGDDRLGPRETLSSGEALVSPDGSQTLVLQPSGQLALFGAAGGDPRWVSDEGDPGDRLVVTAGGDVRLVGSDGKVEWRTATGGHRGATLVLQDDGDLVVRARGGAVVWDTGTTVTPSILSAGDRLGPGESLASPDGRQTLVVGTDGSVTLRGPDGDVRWAPPVAAPGAAAAGAAAGAAGSGPAAAATGTGASATGAGATGAGASGAGSVGASAAAGVGASTEVPSLAVPGSSLALHDDGNLVLSAPDGSWLWRSRTAGHPGATLTLQDDGNLVLYGADGKRVWSTKTKLGPSTLADGSAVPAAGGLASPDGHLRLRASARSLALTYDEKPVWSTPVDLPAGGALVVTDDGLSLVGPDGSAVWTTGAGAGPGSELDLDEGSALFRTSSGVELWRQDVPAALFATAQVTADCTQVPGPVPESATVSTTLGVRVHSCLADAVDAMAAAAAQAGIDLGAGSGWRSAAEQAALRRAHCAPASSDPGAPVLCEPATAPVGASMHERGLALDLTQDGRLLTRGSTGYAWLTLHAAQYGLHNLPGEAWHWSTDGH